MQLALLLPILVPLLVVVLPRALDGLKMAMSINGTYDVLLVPLYLPRSEVQDLLKASKLELAQLPSSAKIADDDTHPVLLQLGYQHATAPGPSWLPKPSFSEAKLEIPFVKHPLAAPSSSSSGPFSYKHTILMSNRFLALASQHTAGLQTHYADFEPARSPSVFEKDAATIAYRAGDFMNAEATIKKESEIEQDAKESRVGWTATREMVEMTWFGQGTGNTVTRFDFDFDKAEIPPTAYSVDVDLNLDLFRGLTSGAAESRRRLSSQLGWRVKAKVVSTASKVA